MKARGWLAVFSVIAFMFMWSSPGESNEDFVPQAVEFIKTSRQHAKVKGKLINNSGKTLPHGDFIIHAYDKTGNLINSASFTIRNFVAGSSREFNTTIQADTRNISSHKVEFKRKEFILIESDKDFTPQNIDFTKTSRRYGKVKGNLINNSGKDLRHADFVIQVYDKAGKLINQASFTIRNFVNGASRSFNTTVQADVRDISSYKIELKKASEIPPTPTEY